MPATRPSTRVQRRAQPTASRRPSTRRRTTTSNATTQRQAATVVTSDSSAPLASTPVVSAPNYNSFNVDETLQRIVSAVSQAVLASINGAGSTHTPAAKICNSHDGVGRSTHGGIR